MGLTDKQKEKATTILASAQDMQLNGKHNQYYSAWCAVTGALSYVGAGGEADSSKTPVANAVEWIISKQNTDNDFLNGVNEMTTEQTVDQMLKQRPTTVWINSKGEFLIVSESTTHTGRHVRAYFTDDLHKATVDYRLPKFNDGTNADDLIPIPAWVERKVTIGKKPEGKAEGKAD